MNTKGVTLIELLIYIALFAILSLIIGKQFKALVNNYAAGKQLSKQQVDSRDVLGLMIREIRNTGVKVYLRPSGTDYIKDTASGTWLSSTNPIDLSSFKHKESASGTYGDTLVAYMARLTTTGDSAGVDTITYYLDGTTLRRGLESTGPNTNSMVAENVYALQFQYGINRSNTALFTQFPIVGNTSTWTYSGTSTITAPAASPWVITFPAGASACSLTTTAVYNVAANTRYRIRLKIDPATTYATNLSYARIGFRQGSNVIGYEDFLPRSTDTMDIFVPIQADGAAAKFFLTFSSTGAGSLSIKGISVPSVELSSFTWVNRFTNGAANTSPDSTSFKIDVRAIKISVLTRTKTKAGTRTTTPIQVGNVSFTPSGEYTWRLYSELVEVLNNGVF